MSLSDLETCLSAAIEAAKAAGKIQKEKLWTEYSIEFKGETNLVTEVDRQCEKLIVEIIRSATPESDILAEEEFYAVNNHPVKWIVDPLDGTTNYAHGFPWFCVSIALEVHGELRVGVIYHPMMDELFTAIKGRGAWLNGKSLSVSRHKPMRNCLLATGFPYDRTCDPDNNFQNFINFQLSARAVRRPGSAALDLAYVAAGRLDGYWECMINPWDVAAGKLLVEEAGGLVTDFAGKPYSIYSRMILASNGHIHQEMVSVLNATGTVPGGG